VVTRVLKYLRESSGPASTFDEVVSYVASNDGSSVQSRQGASTNGTTSRDMEPFSVDRTRRGAPPVSVAQRKEHRPAKAKAGSSNLLRGTMTVYYAIACMFLLIALTRIFDGSMPQCAMCGRKRQHAKDCPFKEREG
jgi:hypothetical protein